MVDSYKKESNHAHQEMFANWKLLQYGIQRARHDREHDRKYHIKFRTICQGGKGIMGGSSIERSDTDLSNHPPINLPPTPLNMTHYSAKYTSQGPLDRNVLVPGETYNKLMYSGCFPVYPIGVQLRHNPKRNNVDFAYDSDKGGNTTSEDDDEDGSESLRNSSGEAESSSDDSNGSYV